MGLMTEIGLLFTARDRSKTQINSFNRSIQRMGRQMLAIAGVGGGLYAFQRGFRSIIKAASDAEETQAKFNTVFKNLSKQANTWAESFGESVGRSNQSVKSWMARLQDTFVPLGIARDRAMELSKSLVSLAVDVASFNNAADADVIRDFTSALVGNHETVRKYGIIIGEVAIKQEAMRKGLNKTYKELTDLEKVQLRYSLIQRGSTDAQGDALRTADSYANQVKRLAANWDNFKVILGGEVLPALTELVKKINENKTSVGAFAKALAAPIESLKILIELAELSKEIFPGAGKAPPFGGGVPGLMGEAERRKDIIPTEESPLVREAKKYQAILIEQGRLRARLHAEQQAQAEQFAKTFLENTRESTQASVEASLKRIEAEDAAAREIDKVWTEMWLKQEETAYHAMRAPIIEAERLARESAERRKRIAEDIALSMASSFSNAIDQMMFEGKEFFDAMEDMARSLIRMIAQIIMYKMVAERIAYGIMGLPVPTGHRGIPADYMPRLHGGLRSDEFPAIIQRGEEIIPKANAGGKGGSLTFILNYMGMPMNIDHYEQREEEDQRIIEVWANDVQQGGTARQVIREEIANVE